MLCQIVSGGQGFDIKVKSLNLIIKDERYLIDNTNYGSPCIYPTIELNGVLKVRQNQVRNEKKWKIS